MQEDGINKYYLGQQGALTLGIFHIILNKLDYAAKCF